MQWYEGEEDAGLHGDECEGNISVSLYEMLWDTKKEEGVTF